MNKYDVIIKKFDEVDSTNRIALESETAPHLFTVVADSQTGGRGRLGRSFFSYSGGLYMSVVLDVTELNIPLNLCTPAAALAVKDSLEHFGVGGIKIKWVNDLYKNNRKICGILTESRSDKGKIEKIVVGIGINLTEPEEGFPEDIKNKAGCAGYYGNKQTLAVDITKRIGALIKSERDDIISRYRHNMAWLGERVTVTDYSEKNKKVSGVIIGVDENCFLSLRLDDGTEKLLSSGEIV